MQHEAGKQQGWTRRRGWGAAAVAAGLLLLGGCGGGDDLPPTEDGVTQGAGWTQIAPQQRQEPLEVQGRTYDGEDIDVAQLRGSVVVLNTWYAECAPCRAEAPVLQSAADRYAPAGVRVVGINVQGDSAARVKAFQDRWGVSFPSIDDADGAVVLGLRGVVPRATPVTLVLDTAGRVAARVAGEVDASTLDGLIDDVLAEGDETSSSGGPAAT